MWIERLMAGISHQHVLSYNPKDTILLQQIEANIVSFYLVLSQCLEKYISPNVDPGHSGTCASELVTSAYGCKPCSAERFLSDLIA